MGYDGGTRRIECEADIMKLSLISVWHGRGGSLVGRPEGYLPDHMMAVINHC